MYKIDFINFVSTACDSLINHKLKHLSKKSICPSSLKNSEFL